MHSMQAMWLCCMALYALMQLTSAQCPAGFSANTSVPEPSLEYQSFDGFFNNIAHPELGAADIAMLRILPPAYSDATYLPREGPNPLTISRRVMAGESGLPSYRNRTVFFVHYGQQVVEEILDAQRPPCIPEYVNIELEEGEEQYKAYTQGFIPLRRARYDFSTGWAPSVPREQLTEISAFFDGTLMYGPNKPWADELRSFEDGMLRTVDESTDLKDMFPPRNDHGLPIANPPEPATHKIKSAKRQYLMGNPRTNENPMLANFGIFWFRVHNLQAKKLKCKYPHWSDEALFFEARKRTIALHQKITYYEWLPMMLNDNTQLPPYDGYKDYVTPQISHVFQSAAMRIGHTMVAPGVFMRDAQCSFDPKPIRTCNSYFRPSEFVNHTSPGSFERLMMGMISQRAEREDHIITEDLRGFVFGGLEASRRDLMAINIQRGRDHGLPSYNVARKYFHLPERATFADITSNAAVAQALQEVYDNKIDDVDIWAGGLAETEDSQGPGDLFSAVIRDQFARIRDGDRFWYENRLNGLFTDDELQEINSTTIRDLLLEVGAPYITNTSIGENPFMFQAGDPCEAPYQPNASSLEPCTEPKTFDYYSQSFRNHHIALIITFWLFGSIILSTSLMLYFVHRGNVRRATLSDVSKHMRKQTARSLGPSDTASAHTRAIATELLTDKTLSLDNDFPKDMDSTSYIAARIRPHGYFSRATNERVFVKVQRNPSKPSAPNTNLNDVVVFNKEGVVITSVAVRDIATLHAGPLYRHMVVECRYGTGCYLVFDALSGAKFTVELDRATTDSVPLLVYNTESEVQAISERTTTAATTRISRALDIAINHVVSGHGTSWKSAFNMALRDSSGQHASASSSGKGGGIDELSCIRFSEVEFAGLTGLPASHDFVDAMFAFADSRGSGFLSVDGVMNVMLPLSTKDHAQRAELFFKFYDKDNSGYLDRAEMGDFVSALYLLTGLDPLDDEQTQDVLNTMIADAGLGDDTQRIDPDQFALLMQSQRDLQAALDQLVPGNSRGDDHDLVPSEEGGDSYTDRKHVLVRWSAWVQTHWLDIFWSLTFLTSVGLIFFERFWFYSVFRLQGGLKGITGNGVATTRGGASAMMWCFSLALLPLCRNTLTLLRSTFVARILPLDSNIEFHKMAATTGGLFVLVHLIGHTINFYNLSTQPAADAGCLFPNVFWTSDFIPSFAWWVFETVTGMSGFLLTIVTIFMFVFSIPYSRRGSFQAFWMVHHLWSAFYFLLFLHGIARLVQQPIFFNYALGPLLLFTVDKLVSFSRSHHTLKVEEAILLPSGVTALLIEKPPGFEGMQSGQWLRIKCSAVSANEWHPFTISSAPQEEFVSVHIRTAGPWTGKLRRVIAARLASGDALPDVQIEGPFGEIHQDWLHAEACVFVGGGIGVTPFASILQDLAWRYRNNQKVKPQRVHFVWVTRTQKEYEWMVELLKEVQEEIPENVLTVDIYITQGKKNYDIRTALMFMFERNTVKATKVSLLTGVRATTNFRRPNMGKLLRKIRDQYHNMHISIYTCGPPPLAAAVEAGTNLVNEEDATVIRLKHHYVSF
eukprot:m.352947 g.352947  ORF g.352947 m.352947 type:complete len:1560 (-) comp16652_c0_seq1:288-4967(-)